MDEAMQQLNSMDQSSLTSMIGQLQPGGFDVWSLLASFIFGVVGFYGFINGKKNGSWRRMIVGILLMGYPYFVQGALWTCLVGLFLSGLLYLWRED